jgi:RNA polymerase sigma-70 factor (ECF subfamily)
MGAALLKLESSQRAVEGPRQLDTGTVELARKGDTRAFSQLVRVYQDRVYGLCLALGGSDAEDLAQETFVRVHKAIARFDPGGPARLSTWILTIARRLCQDRAKGARVRSETLLQSLPELPEEGLSPEERLAQARTRERLIAAIAELPEEQRSVVALRAWEGLDYDDIAAVEQIPVGTVRSRLSRAREALRKAIEENGR